MRMELPERKKLVYQQLLTIRWGDMDAMGHVNNVSYFRFMETTRIYWFRSLNVQPDGAQQGPIIVNAFCNFYRQLVYPGDILMRMYASDPARSTFETWTTMERADQPGVVYAAGGATTIWVDFTTQKAVNLPDFMRQLVSVD